MMEPDEYRKKVCHNCETEPMCQHSNIEDCMKLDAETDEANKQESEDTIGQYPLSG